AIAERPLALAAWTLDRLGGGHTMWLLFGAGLRARCSPGGCPAAQIRRPAEVLVGRSTTSRQTTTGTNALEVDVPPCHQRDAAGEDAGGGHVANCATDIDIRPNRARFALRVSK